jgi:hypothetical protein
MDSEVIDRLWEQVEPTVYITREQWVSGLADWDIEAVRIDGTLAFAALTRGPEFHFASFDTGTPISMSMIRSRLAPIIERHGFVTTRTPKEGADRQHRFNRAFGFHTTGEDEFFVHYRLNNKCP